MINRRTFLATSAAMLAMPTILRAQQSPYKVGALLAMSGPNAFEGQTRLEGIELALEHLKADGKLKRGIELTVEDSQGTPVGGATAVTKLINVSQSQFLLTQFTGVSKAAAPIAERAKITLANVGGLSPDLAALTPYFWNVNPLATKEVQQMLPFLAEKKLARMVIIYVDDPFGGGMRAWLEKNLPGNGGELVEGFSVPGNTQQFSAIAAKVRSLKPDAVFIASYGAQQAQIIKQLRDNGVDAQLLSYSGTVNNFVQTLPEAEGLVFGMPSPTSSDAVTTRFREDFIKKFNKKPAYMQQNSYNGILLFATLAARLDEAGTAVDGDSLNKELQSVKSFDLVGGKGEIDQQFVMDLPVQISTFRSGEIVAV